MLLLYGKITFVMLYGNVYIYQSFQADLVYTASTESFTYGHFTMTITKRELGELDITEVTLIISKVNY